jgi:prepilin-type N-terminal cleavage/methylation domain-containing protein
MHNRGITLIELIIVVSVIGILVVALGFSFQGWIGGYNVERGIKEMYIDLMNARARAMQKNRVHFVTLTPTQYTIYEDTNPALDGNGTLETASDLKVLQKNLDSRYPITWSDISDTQIDFTKRGLSNDTKTICSNTKADADYNCIEISASRINIGKLTTKIPDGGACLSDNCVAK